MSRTKHTISSPKPIVFSIEENISYGEGEDRNTTILLHTLSTLFPEGEKLFVKAVRHYQHLIDRDSSLGEDIRKFIGQEAHHSIAHDKLNKELYDKLGVYDPTKALQFWLGGLLKTSPRLSLHITCCLEHWTATLARQILDNEYPLTISQQALWNTHAREEIEHEAVAYDVLIQTSKRPRLEALACKALFLPISLIFITATAIMYVINGGHVDSRLFLSLSKNIPTLLKWLDPEYRP